MYSVTLTLLVTNLCAHDQTIMTMKQMTVVRMVQHKKRYIHNNFIASSARSATPLRFVAVVIYLTLTLSKMPLMK